MLEKHLKNKFKMKTSNADHLVLWYECGRKKKVATHMSWGKTKYKTLSDDLLGLMAKQLGLNLSEFKRGIQCTMSKEQWDRIICQSS